MSILYCHECDRYFDSDGYELCPRCRDDAEEGSQAPVQSDGEVASAQREDTTEPSNPGEETP